eukprot:3041680-Pleurochrysis_carterae.AAC.4
MSSLIRTGRRAVRAAAHRAQGGGARFLRPALANAPLGSLLLLAPPEHLAPLARVRTCSEVARSVAQLTSLDDSLEKARVTLSIVGADSTLRLPSGSSSVAAATADTARPRLQGLHAVPAGSCSSDRRPLDGTNTVAWIAASEQTFVMHPLLVAICSLQLPTARLD